MDDFEDDDFEEEYCMGCGDPLDYYNSGLDLCDLCVQEEEDDE